MKSCRVIVLTLLTVFAAACSNSRYAEFPETVAAATQPCAFDSVFMRYPYRVALFDSTLYVMDLHPDEFYCHEFGYPSMKFVRSFAGKGKAPGELIGCVNIAVDSKGAVVLLDCFGRKIYTCDPNGGRVNLLTELPEEGALYPDFALYSDSVFIFPDYSGQSRIFLADRHGNIFRKTGTIPATEKDGNIPEASSGEMWRAFIGYNAVNGIAALATQFGEVLEVYDLRNDRTRVVVGKSGEPKFGIRDGRVIPDGIMGYCGIFVGEKYIYALFEGHEIDKMRRREITVIGGKYVHVFDTEGNPVRRYELDRHLTGLYVNEKTGKAIGTDVNESQLVTFDL